MQLYKIYLGVLVYLKNIIYKSRFGRPWKFKDRDARISLRRI